MSLKWDVTSDACVFQTWTPYAKPFVRQLASLQILALKQRLLEDETLALSTEDAAFVWGIQHSLQAVIGMGIIGNLEPARQNLVSIAE